jgi:hypothetical protein
MSQNINITTDLKTQVNFSTTTNSKTTSKTTSNETIIRGESNSVSYNSKFDQFFPNRAFQENYINFEDTEDQIDDEFKEIKENFIMEAIGGFNLYDSICNGRLAELNRQNDDRVKSKLYSSVIQTNKESIVKIKNQEINFEKSYKSQLVYSQMQQTIRNFCSHFEEFSNHIGTFEEELIKKISEDRIGQDDLEKIKVFITGILDSKNEPQMRNIGVNTDLKIKYIKLANFLLKFKSYFHSSTNHSGISQYLKTYLNKVISLRNNLQATLTGWIKFLVQEIYEFCHQIEGLVIDRSFIDTFQYEHIKETRETTVEKIIYVEKDQEKNVYF